MATCTAALRTACGVLVVASVAGCGAAPAMLRAPVAERCNAAGVSRCADLTDGVLDYVDGDRAVALSSISNLVDASEPERIRAFADALDAIAGVPALGSAGDAVREVAVFLKGEVRFGPADDARQGPNGRAWAGALAAPVEAAPRPSPGDARAESSGARPALDVARMRGATIVPVGHPKAGYCAALSTIAPLERPSGSSARSVCVRAFIGPLVVTDLHAGGCAMDLFVLAGRPEDPEWFLLNPPGAALDVHGAGMLVRDGQELVVGARVAGSDLLRREPACSVTWHGWKPDDTEAPAAPALAAFDGAAADRALRDVDLSGCATGGGPSGPGHLVVTFSPDGRVASAVVDASPYEGTRVGECVARRFRLVSVPPFGGASRMMGKFFNLIPPLR
jgi:hypothetical protein